LEIVMKTSVRRELWKERVQQWRNSGLSQRAFALQHGWPIRQAGYWIRQLRDDVAPPAAMELIPVSIKRANVSVAEPAILLRGASGWSVEIPANQGAAWLADLLQRLA
jgi:hypothetical protein